MEKSDVLDQVTKPDPWTLKDRYMVHFVGICGAGKTSLCSQLALDLQKAHIPMMKTLDYDPDIPDDQRLEERAFSRLLDQQNNAQRESGGGKPSVSLETHQNITKHALNVLEAWQRSVAQVVLVDRWYESYDDLSEESIAQIEKAILNSNFKVLRILLEIGPSKDLWQQEATASSLSDLNGTPEDIKNHLLETAKHRAKSWWPDFPNRLEAFSHEEWTYQQQYRAFCEKGPFAHLKITTNQKKWECYSRQILGALMTTQRPS